MERQFTASVYIFDEDNQKVLMIYHRKLQKWLPPGGHMDANETPPEAARREAREETGLEIEFIAQENVWVDRWNANSFERPYLCLLEEIPSVGGQPAHQHMDMVYVARKNGGTLIESSETDGIRWFSMEDVEKLNPESEIFLETIQVLRHLFSSLSFSLVT